MQKKKHLIWSHDPSLSYIMGGHNTLKHLYKTVSYTRWFKGGPQKCGIQTRMYRLYRKMTIYGHFSI